MAALETKVIRVENNEHTLNSTATAMSCFGWTVTNVQITHSQNSRTYSSAWDQLGGNQSQTVETTTINYATMTLQRDRGLLNYQQIVALEAEYNAITAKMNDLNDRIERSEHVGCLSILIWPLFIYKTFFNSTSKNLTKQYQEYDEQRQVIMNRAAALLG